MKYLSLFESFDSNKLNKTLGYLDKNSKNEFITIIKNICDKFDIPYSKVSDEEIQYSGYQAALKKYKNSDDSKIQLIKSWFTAEGKYIISTGVSGKVKDHKIMDEFDVVGDIEVEDLLKMDNGTPVYTKVRYTSGKLNGEGVGFLYKGTRNDEPKNFIVQDFAAGLVGDDSQELIELKAKFDNKLFKFWSASPNALTGTKLLRRKENGKDPMKFNFKLKSDYTCGETLVTEALIKDAYFALIIDVAKLRADALTNYGNKLFSLKGIKDARKDARKDAMSFSKDEDIKKANIDRYMKKLKDIDPDISNCKRFVSRLIGGNKMLLLWYVSSTSAVLSDLMNIYYDILISDTDTKSKRAVKKLKSYYDERLTRTNKYKEKVDHYLEKYESEYETDHTFANSSKVIKLTKDLSKFIFDVVMSKEINTIDDLEILLTKINSCADIISSSRSELYKVWSYIENSSSAASIRILRDDLPNAEKLEIYIKDRLKPMLTRILNA